MWGLNMDTMLVIIIIGAVGLIAMLLIRTRSHREALRYRARMMDVHHRTVNADFETRQLVLGYLLKNDRFGAMQAVHERTGMSILDSRVLVDQIADALKRDNQNQKSEIKNQNPDSR